MVVLKRCTAGVSHIQKGTDRSDHHPNPNRAERTLRCQLYSQDPPRSNYPGGDQDSDGRRGGKIDYMHFYWDYQRPGLPAHYPYWGRHLIAEVANYCSLQWRDVEHARFALQRRDQVNRVSDTK